MEEDRSKALKIGEKEEERNMNNYESCLERKEIRVKDLRKRRRKLR